jgi:tetratricopeptide (TPR) repeat protein
MEKSNLKTKEEVDMKKKNPIKVFMHVAIVMFFAGFSISGLAQHEHMHDDHPVPEGASIGDVDFRVSCNEAREDFDYALGMMHHMMYVSARAEFENIIENHPDCAMAYWGVATTLFQPLWGTRPDEEDLQRGWRKIEKARELADNERERYLIESTAGFFKEPSAADFHTRLERWTDGVKDAYRAYPDDPDIAALYGLSLLTIAQHADEREPLFDEAEEVLRGVFEQIPKHPGAIHYSIHATDVDGRAENALDMVEVYGEIAPEVPHALHMPSHIYVRLGDWPQVIDWNIASAEAALDHPAGDAESHHYIHAIDYIVYAALQQGNDEKAESYFEEAWIKEKHQPTFVSAFHAAAMPARIAVEQRDWERAAALEPRTPDYLPWDQSPWAEGLTWFALGLGAIHTGDAEKARNSEERLDELREKAIESGDHAMATYIEIDRLILAGRIAHLRGNDFKALELTRSAAELERTIEKHPVTPGALVPPYEALGNLLMELNRPSEALEAYLKSDEIWPERYNTLLGAARAANDAGEEETAIQLFGRLLTIAGDSDRPALEEVWNFVTEN